MQKAFDAILLLGVELNADDSPTAEMIARVDEAARAYREGVLGEDGVLIPCGGVLPGKMRAEAQVMAELLEARGVARSRIHLEAQSQTTMENMRFAKTMLSNVQKPRVLVVTSDYHLRRAVLTARRAGLRAKGRAAALAHDEAWQEKRSKELAYTADLLLGWQDEGRQRPQWTQHAFDAVFGKKKRSDRKNHSGGY